MAPTTDTEAIAEHVRLAGRRVVDVGSGEGAMVRWLRSQGAEAVGVECGEEMRARALASDPEHPDAYLDGVGEDLPLPDESADVVCFFRSLHHVPVENMRAALGEAHRVLRPGGIVYVVEPVAAGPNFEVGRLVEDETAVRAAAQHALDQAGTLGLETGETFSYATRNVYADIDAWTYRQVGVDPARAAVIERRHEEVVRAFHQHGRPTADGWAFDQEHLVRVLTRASTGGR